MGRAHQMRFTYFKLPRRAALSMSCAALLAYLPACSDSKLTECLDESGRLQGRQVTLDAQIARVQSLTQQLDREVAFLNSQATSLQFAVPSYADPRDGQLIRSRVQFAALRLKSSIQSIEAIARDLRGATRPQ